MTPLDDYHGLLDLMLNECDRGRKFDLDDVPCEIKEHDGHGLFIAATSAFGIALTYPRWYRGEVTETPVHIDIVGDHYACFEWLPIDPEDKRAIIARLPISRCEQVLLTLAV